jgi:hypothetical protein
MTHENTSMQTPPALKPPVSAELRQRVIELHHCHTLRDTATMTGLPLGTVKTLCSRSGAFRDNTAHRALFSLPPIRPTAQTLPAVPALPPQVRVTGDAEVDAVLWLRQVIDTGQAGLIEKAMKAAKCLATPLKELEKRYVEYLKAQNPGNVFAALFGSLGFGDLEALARTAVERECLQSEARARFGDDLFADTEAEAFCIETLAGLALAEKDWGYEKAAATACFQSRPELMPNTLSDCLHELDYWLALYRLRHAVDRDCGDSPPAAHARERFVLSLLARRRPCSKDEAVAVFRYLVAERMDDKETEAILLNLVGHG